MSTSSSIEVLGCEIVEDGARKHAIPETPRIMYLKSGCVMPPLVYLLLLSRCCNPDFAKQLLQAGVQSIKHGAGEGYYQTLLQGKLYQERLPIDIDVGVAGDVLSLDPVSAAKRPSRGFHLEENFCWGCVSFLYKRPARPGRPATLQCNCPRRSHQTRHPNGSITWCTHAHCRCSSRASKSVKRR